MDYLCDYCMHVMSLCEIVFILPWGSLVKVCRLNGHQTLICSYCCQPFFLLLFYKEFFTDILKVSFYIPVNVLRKRAD